MAISVSCGEGSNARQEESNWSIDQRSYNLGGIGAFAEMVGAGVKQLALSAPLDSSEMDAILPDARRIAANHGVEIYREPDFLVSDLFPAGLTEGKDVLLICRDSTYEKYINLKELKRQLVDSEQYSGEARTGLARQFGALLSYSDAKISSLLSTGSDSRAR